MFNKAKWHGMSLAEQMGNIGCEISRAFYWKRKDPKMAKQMFNQTLELFDLTISDKRRIFQLTEILKLRSVFCDCFFDLGNFKVSEESLKKYFIPFALLAAKRFQR